MHHHRLPKGEGQAVARESTTYAPILLHIILEAAWSFGEQYGCTFNQLEMACIPLCENETNDLLKVVRTFLIYCCCKNRTSRDVESHPNSPS